MKLVLLAIALWIGRLIFILAGVCLLATFCGLVRLSWQVRDQQRRLDSYQLCLNRKWNPENCNRYNPDDPDYGGAIFSEAKP